MRPGLTKTGSDNPSLEIDFGTGSEIYWISYTVNDQPGKTTMCPNAPNLTITDIHRKHKLKKIVSFQYEIIKQIGLSQYY